MDVELALKINKYIHDTCENVPHDTGLKIMEIIERHEGEKSGPPFLGVDRIK